MYKLLAVAAGAVVMAGSPAFAATNLVANGSFETGNFSGWTVTGGTGGTDTAPVVIPYNSAAGYPGGAFGEPIPPANTSTLSPDAAGNFTAYFSSDNSRGPQTLSQTVMLTGGYTYNIGFDYYAPQNGVNNPFDAQLRFLINGVQVGGVLQAGGPAGTTPTTWFNFNTQFVALNSGPQSYTFEFQGLGQTAADFAIDRVYAVTAVPEPSTWALLILGFGLVGGAMRRKRTAVAFA